jgi:uncharacterized membrane protein
VPFAEVQPILKKYCYDCHGGTLAPEGTADSAKARGGYALDTAENAAKTGRGRGSKPGIVAGKADESEVVLRIQRGAGARGKMPGGQMPKVMAPEEIQKLVDWVNGGAQFK